MLPLVFAAALAAPDPQLARLIGTWHGTSQRLSGAKPSISHSTIVCSATPGGGAFVVCDIKGGNGQQTLAVYTRDPGTGKYWYGEFSPGRDPYRNSLTIHGNDWTYSGSYTSRGKTVEFRTVNHFEGDTETFESYYSDDLGHTWHTISRGTATRGS